MGQEPEGKPAEGDEPAAGKQPEEVQEPKGKEEPQTFDREYVEKLRAEAAKHRTEAQAAKSKVQEFEDAQKSEQEKLADERDSLKNEAEGARAESLRLRVALQKKLPAELIDRLKGDSQEELEADADELLKLVKPADATDFDGGARKPAPEKKSPEQAHNEDLLRLVGREPT